MSAALSLLLLSAAMPQAAAQQDAAPAPAPAPAQSSQAEPGQDTDRSKAIAPPASTNPPALFDNLFGTTRGTVAIDDAKGPASDQLNLARLLAGPYELSAALPLYPQGQSWCVPADSFLDALELEHHSSEGALEVTHFEPLRRQSLPLSRLLPSPEGPCLDLVDAGRLTESELVYDPGSLELRLLHGEHLPSVTRAERETTRKARMAPADSGTPAYPVLDNPWHAAGMPTIDIALQTGLAQGRTRASLTADGSGDLLWSTARWRLGLDQGGSVRFSGRLEHVDPDGGILGPLNARRIEIGDISAPPQPLIATAMPERGLIVSSAPEWRAEIFDRIVIEGQLGPGWRAELLIDGRLAAYVDAADENGLYRFRDVPLKTGLNRFVVELFGPHGERDRREIIRQVGSALNAENETFVTFGLLGGTSGGGNPPSGTSPANSPAAVFATLATGLSSSTSLRADLRHAISGSANGAGLTVDSSVLGGALALSLAQRSPGGSAYAGAFSRRLGSWNATVSLRDNGPLPSAWDLGMERELRRSLDLSLGGAFALGSLPLAISVGAQNAITREGVARTAVKIGATARRGAFRFSNDLAVDFASQTQLAGTFSAQWTRRASLLRAFVNYQAQRQWSMQSAGATFSSQSGAFYYTASAAYDFAASSPSISFGANRRTGAFDLAAEMGWSKTSGPALSIAARVALGPRPGRGLGLLPAGASRSATLVPQLANDDGQPVAGGRYLVASSLRAETGGEDGATLIGGLPTNRPVSLALQLSSLEDERLRPDREGAQIVLRPGQVYPVPLRLSPTGLVEIRLIHGSDERQDPLAGQVVTLVDSTGQMFEAKSDFDGYALFVGLPYGQYLARGHFGNVTRQQTIVVSREADDISAMLRF